MKTRLVVLFIAFALVVGCRSKSEYNKAILAERENFSQGDNLIQAPPPPPPPSESAQTNVEVEKKIIKTAYLNIEVLNYSSSRKLIDSALKHFNAYVVSENLQNTEYQIGNSINIKVPANQFEMLLANLAKLAKKVDSQNIETRDVTEEYIDVQTRLNNSKKVEQTYLKLLRKTNSIEDILKIEQKLGEIRTDIESTEGRLKYLNHQVSYSSINLNVYQTLEYKYNPEKLPNFFQRLKKAVSLGWNGIVVFFLFLIGIWPLWILAVVGYYLWKYIVKYRRERKKDEKRRRKLQKKMHHDDDTQGK